jgi:hypothetical protein
MDIDPQYPTIGDEARAALLAAKVDLEAEGTDGGTAS